MTDQWAGQFGCDKPGHPQNYSHDCDDWDTANEWAESIERIVIPADESEPTNG